MNVAMMAVGMKNKRNLSDVFIVGETPYWFLENPVSNKVKLAFVASNDANLRIALDPEPSLGAWYFDLSSPWTDEDADDSFDDILDAQGAICKFVYVARFVGCPLPKDTGILIRLALETFSRTKKPLIRYAEKDDDDISVDDALDTGDKPTENVFVDIHAIQAIKNIVNQKGENDKLAELVEKLKGLDLQT